MTSSAQPPHSAGEPQDDSDKTPLQHEHDVALATHDEDAPTEDTPTEAPSTADTTATDTATIDADEAALARHEELSVPASEQIRAEDSDDEITEKLRAQGVKIGKFGIAPRVFWPSMLVILAVGFVGVAFPERTGTVFTSVQGWIVSTLGWYYMLIVGGFVAFTVVVGLSRMGDIRLGRDDEEPEFGVFSWFAMLFAAGMGIGLVFYGVGEPLTYATVSPKPGWEGSEAELQGLAMAQTFIHWGLHPWSIYSVIGLALAYAIHRRGRPVSIRWALEPLLGYRVKGWMGDAIDILAIFGTVFGVATSLGLGVQQISAGMAAMGIVDSTDNTLLVILIIVITFLATLSVVSGLGAGIRWLSNINLSLAGLLLISMLVLGPTVFLLQNFVESLGVYLANLMQMTFDVGAYQRGEEAASWFTGWTIFYWGWWIAWSPFVGVFIARISKGRTIRQFVAGVLLVPTIVGFLWFAVMGGSGLFRQMYGEGDLVADGAVSVESALFQVLDGLPLGSILSVIAIILVAVFFITSSDSGSLVVDMLASGGHPNPPTWSRVVWALLEGFLATGLLLAGGLEALQAGSLITALPFSVVLILMCVSTIQALVVETRARDHIKRRQEMDRLRDYVTEELTGNLEEFPEFESYVDRRIDYRISRTRGVFARGRGRQHDRPAR
ncbi:BCCT family transporter [Kocuria soli]|uniref:BCCT family transporter n=1 Tax=Kocuria soli TaxID=2485125 RepID=A0A3N3ZS15_9MICC|nr:BCCT family transporter [Kocuria soli]ROZ63309.1 BCCT family transporter [Kocuria soli]